MTIFLMSNGESAVSILYPLLISGMKQGHGFWQSRLNLQNNFLQHLDNWYALKGKFSSGIEGALALTLNRNFNWKKLSEMILCIFCDVFKVYLSNIDSKTAEIHKKGDFEFWAWASHFIMIWNITVRYKFWRTYFFQVLYPYYVKNHMKAMLHWHMCSCILKLSSMNRL